MPYKRKGKIILHYKNGRWRIKQKAKSILNAKKTLRLLHWIEHTTKLKLKKQR